MVSALETSLAWGRIWVLTVLIRTYGEVLLYSCKRTSPKAFSSEQWRGYEKYIDKTNVCSFSSGGLRRRYINRPRKLGTASCRPSQYPSILELCSGKNVQLKALDLKRWNEGNLYRHSWVLHLFYSNRIHGTRAIRVLNGQRFDCRDFVRVVFARIILLYRVFKFQACFSVMYQVNDPHTLWQSSLQNFFYTIRKVKHVKNVQLLHTLSKSELLLSIRRRLWLFPCFPRA